MILTKHTTWRTVTSVIWAMTLCLWGGRRLTVAFGRSGWRPLLRWRVWGAPLRTQRTERRLPGGQLSAESDLEYRRRHA